MWHGQNTGPGSMPVFHGIGHTAFVLGQVILQSILTDDQDQIELIQMCQELLTPSLSALGAWRQVTVITAARIAKAHRQNSYLSGIIELLAIDAQPVSELVPTSIIKRHSSLMHLTSGRLAGD